jgi:hypothetical protein
VGFTGGQDKSLHWHAIVWEVEGGDDCNKERELHIFMAGCTYTYTALSVLRDGPIHIGGGAPALGGAALVMETYLTWF